MNTDKMRKAFLVIFSMIILDAYSQDNAFISFYSKGDVMLNSEKGEQLLEEGMFIHPGDFLQLPNDCKVILVTESGHNIVMQKKGKYSYQDILKKDESSSITSAYFSYVWKKFSKHESKDPDKTPMGVVGGVKRSDDTWMTWPYDGATIEGATIAFEWGDVAPLYYFMILNENEETILKLQTESTSIKIYPIESGLRTDHEYSWIVSNTSSISNKVKNRFFIPGTDWWNEYENQKKVLIKQLEIMDDAIKRKNALELFNESKGIFLKE